VKPPSTMPSSIRPSAPTHLISSIPASLVHGAPHPAYHAVTMVDRHAFGVVVTRTDALVGNDVTILLDVQTK
jgi:hypothetical protein